MVLRKATASTEAGKLPTAVQRSQLARLIDETTRAGVHCCRWRRPTTRTVGRGST
jgi:hypothetical protein